MGVAVDVGEVEGVVVEEGEGFVEAGAQDDGAGAVFGQAAGGGVALADVVPAVAGPHVDGVEAAQGGVPQQVFGVSAPGDAELDPEPGQVAVDEQGGEVGAAGDLHGDGGRGAGGKGGRIGCRGRDGAERGGRLFCLTGFIRLGYSRGKLSRSSRYAAVHAGNPARALRIGVFSPGRGGAGLGAGGVGDDGVPGVAGGRGGGGAASGTLDGRGRGGAATAAGPGGGGAGRDHGRGGVRERGGGVAGGGGIRRDGGGRRDGSGGAVCGGDGVSLSERAVFRRGHAGSAGGAAGGGDVLREQRGARVPSGSVDVRGCAGPVHGIDLGGRADLEVRAGGVFRQVVGSGRAGASGAGAAQRVGLRAQRPVPGGAVPAGADFQLGQPQEPGRGALGDAGGAAHRVGAGLPPGGAGGLRFPDVGGGALLVRGGAHGPGDPQQHDDLRDPGGVFRGAGPGLARGGAEGGQRDAGKRAAGVPDGGSGGGGGTRGDRHDGLDGGDVRAAGFGVSAGEGRLPETGAG